MRYARIFLLNFQQAFLNVGLIILFWFGASISQKANPNTWSFDELSSYYLLALISNQIIMPHMENDISRLDIKQGNLACILMKPFSYILLWFFKEIPWRIIGGFFAVVTAVFFICTFKLHFVFAHSLGSLLLAICIAVCGFFIGFLFKMILGIFAFWVIEIRGIFEAVEVITVILVGNLMPLNFLPHWIATISYISPFSYIIYFPVMAFEGKIEILQSLQLLGIQCIWITMLYFLYKVMWNEGLKKFTAVGQ